jgi:hypothetical protein
VQSRLAVNMRQAQAAIEKGYLKLQRGWRRRI